MGPAENYYLPTAYVAQSHAVPYDDTSCGDEWQLEVYAVAHELFVRERLRTVLDFGCGSAFKLLKYFSDAETTGIDTPKTVDYLRGKYPGRRWISYDLDSGGAGDKVDLAICSDVIEHVPNPRRLLEFLQSLDPKWLVLSSPDRNLVRNGRHNGPPANPAHVREWTMPQLRALVGDFFRVDSHFISNASQCTQCIIARPFAKSKV